MTRAATARTGWILAGLLSIALTVAFVQYNRATRPTIFEVAGQAAIQLNLAPAAAQRNSVDDLGFPRASEGFHVIGGSTFTVDERPGAAIVWARGEQRITYAIVSGTDRINAEFPQRLTYAQVRGEKRELVWIGDQVLTFRRDERTVVMTGTPHSEQLRRIMRGLATAL
jgi:hypothetical protein